MKSKTKPVTLQAIGKLIARKIDQKFDQKLGPINKNLTNLNTQVGGLNTQVKSLNTKIVGIYGELDGIKQQITGVSTELETHRKETKAGFDGVYDGLSELANTIDRNVEPRLKRLEGRTFA